MAFIWTDLLAQAAPTPEAQAAPATWSGNYHRVLPANADLTLTRTSAGTVAVTIIAAGTPRGPHGEGTAADCTVTAEGRPSNGTLEAAVTPLDANDKARVMVQLKGRRLAVTSDFVGCGLGLTFDGYYAPGGKGAVLTPDSALLPKKSLYINPTGLTGVPANATIAAVHAHFAGDQLRATPEKGMVRIEIVGSGVAFGLTQAAAPSASKLSWKTLDPDTHVTFLETTSPRFITGDGVHVGMTLSEASDRSGPPQFVQDGQTRWAHFPDEADGYDFPLNYRITRKPHPTIGAIRIGAAPTSSK